MRRAVDGTRALPASSQAAGPRLILRPRGPTYPLLPDGVASRWPHEEETLRQKIAANADPGSAGRAPLTAIVSLLALALATLALATAVIRPGVSSQDPCRTEAWDALPKIAALPAGWTTTASGFYVDSAGTTLVGPTPSGSSAPGLTVFVSVGCYGGDARRNFALSHAADLAAGASTIAFPSLGDESYAVTDAAGGTTSVAIRQGELVATLAAASGIDMTALAQSARAVDDAMAAAQAGAAAGSPASLAPAAPTKPFGSTTTAAPSASVGASGAATPAATAAHAAPDLEALLPKSVNGTALVSQSTTGATALGPDATSQALVKSLAGFGKTAADLRLAEADDPSGGLDLVIFAFEVQGVPAASLRQAIITSWLVDAAPSATTTTLAIGGKQVTKVDYGDGGTLDYLFDHDAVVFDLETSDSTLAAQVIGLLP